MRKLLLSLAILLTLGAAYNFVSAQTEPFPYDIGTEAQQLTSTNLDQVVQAESLTPTTSIMSRLTNFFRVS